MELILGIVTTMCIGLMIGTEFAVSVFVNPILEKLGDSAQAHATRLFARKLGTVMPFWYGLNFLLLIGETITRRQHSGMTLLAAASVVWAAVILLSLDTAGANRQPHCEDGFHYVHRVASPGAHKMGRAPSLARAGCQCSDGLHADWNPPVTNRRLLSELPCGC
jgi:hypothetical protein